MVIATYIIPYFDAQFIPYITDNYIWGPFQKRSRKNDIRCKFDLMIYWCTDYS